MSDDAITPFVFVYCQLFFHIDHMRALVSGGSVPERKSDTKINELQWCSS